MQNRIHEIEERLTFYMKYVTTIKKIVLYHLDMMWEKNECIVRLTVIVEEDDYVGFSGY
jgi:hypothetical protein